MAVIFDIKRFAIHDGPGIRTTVFFKGCPLRCAWCHNPESMGADICQVAKTVRMGDKLFTDMETVGRKIVLADLLKELAKEQVFMDESGGGVTFSGGEPLMQSTFLSEALKACKEAGMHTAVDTSGYARWEILEEVAAYTDLFLFDLKMMDDTLHQQYTGVSNERILSNLKALSALGKTIWIRLPMVEQVTFSDSNIQQTLDFLKLLPHKPQSVDLLPYHNTASHKYERFSIENQFDGMKSLSKTELENTRKLFEQEGFSVKIGG